MADLTGKVVLITGASSGFGRDAALGFARAGCRVILSARRMDRLQELAQRIRDEGGQAIPVQADLLDLQDIQSLAAAALEQYGQIDILFNNAGMGRVGWLETHSLDRDLDQIVQLNLTALMQVTRAVLPSMLARRSGHIINMVSVAGLVSSPLLSAYCASKAGARAFTDVIRRETAPFGIKVSGIYPGPASTEFGQHVGESRTYSGLRKRIDIHMSSEYVARRVLNVARRPRRSLIIPWWFRVPAAIEAVFPALADWIFITFSKFTHTQQ